MAGSVNAPPSQWVVLVRHGETQWSASGRHTGRTDVPLTETGRRQARDLAACLGEWAFERALTSPLSRAVETARLAGFGDGLEFRPDLVEWDYGRYEGLTTPQIRQVRPGWDLWKDGCPDGETAEDVGRRADRVIEEVRAVDGDTALFAHGHVLRVLAARWVGLSPESGSRFALDTATVSALGFERETAVITRWNQPCSGPAAAS
jgi:probable phosphoglycerate mutase